VDNAEIAAKLARAHADVLGAAAKQSPQPGPTGAFATQVVVRAPIGGMVMQRAVGPGQFVESAASGGSNALLTISDLSHVFFVAQVTEDQIARIRIGDAVTVRMDAFPGRTFDARVNFIAPSVDPNTHRIAVRARVENPDVALKPGMFGSFRIYTGAAEDHLAVPEAAVIFEGDTARVWITGPHRSIALRYIKAGKTVDGTVEVLSGLRAGDRVITGGSVFIDREAQGGD
jgi:cobalt-zinc-cadmium efflux system membrane fusion protein